MKLHEKTLKIKREVLGERDPDTLISMHNLVRLPTIGCGEIRPRRVKLLKETYEIRREVLGERDPRHDSTPMGMLGMVYPVSRPAD